MCNVKWCAITILKRVVVLGRYYLVSAILFIALSLQAQIPLTKNIRCQGKISGSDFELRIDLTSCDSTSCPQFLQKSCPIQNNPPSDDEPARLIQLTNHYQLLQNTHTDLIPTGTPAYPFLASHQLYTTDTEGNRIAFIGETPLQVNEPLQMQHCDNGSSFIIQLINEGPSHNTAKTENYSLVTSKFMSDTILASTTLKALLTIQPDSELHSLISPKTPSNLQKTTTLSCQIDEE